MKENKKGSRRQRAKALTRVKVNMWMKAKARTVPTACV